MTGSTKNFLEMAGEIKIAVRRDRATRESRVSATPETVKRFIALGASVVVESGAGTGASIGEHDYRASEIVAAYSAKGADIVLGVQGG